MAVLVQSGTCSAASACRCKHQCWRAPICTRARWATRQMSCPRRARGAIVANALADTVQEMYCFQDRSNNSLTLRPEGTAGAWARVVLLQHGSSRGSRGCGRGYACSAAKQAVPRRSEQAVLFRPHVQVQACAVRWLSTLRPTLAGLRADTSGRSAGDIASLSNLVRSNEPQCCMTMHAANAPAAQEWN